LLTHKKIEERDIPMSKKIAVIAVGGNSLILDNKHPEVSNQWDAAQKTCVHIANMIEVGWNVVLTHGNGPQVGFILRRNELAAHEVHTTPLDLISADTQGAIGYMLQQTLNNELHRRKISQNSITIITQVVVDKNDMAFQHPTKPIGGFMDEVKARTFEQEGWKVVEDAGRGWRRVIASPEPLEIVELDVIHAMIEKDYIVVACGGGGIPVYRDEQGHLHGMIAVIDKDRASSLLANKLNADLFVISTAVEKVAINFNKPNQQNLDKLTISQAKQYMAGGEFAEGSMKPKIEAVIRFIENGGKQSLITNPENIQRALNGETGTWIYPD
jgi:carbamate kinase